MSQPWSWVQEVQRAAGFERNQLNDPGPLPQGQVCNVCILFMENNMDT